MTVTLDRPEEGHPANGTSIGVVLRAERIRLGQSLGELADQLRIRQAYLQAIEEGRYGDLPGATYATGFVRAYADALALDASAIVARFKQETAGGMDTRSQLVFPSPVSEGRVPGGAVLFLGLILAGAAYGAWYYASSRDASFAEMVPALPERLRVLLGESSDEAMIAGSIQSAAAPRKDEIVPPAEQEGEPAGSPTASVETAPAPAQPQAAPAVAESGAATATPSTGTGVAPAAATPQPPAAVESTVAAVTAAPAAAIVPAAIVPAAIVPAAPAAAVAVPAAPAPAIAAPVAAPPAPVASVAAVPPPPPSEVGAVGGEGPRVYGQNNVDSRILLRASDDAWIQVRDGETLLLTRLMRKGDTYRVPNRPGLTLMTGSAGALELVVDGRATPSLGPVGTVRRDIALDPDKLLGGR